MASGTIQDNEDIGLNDQGMATVKLSIHTSYVTI